jgi:ribosomal protein S18 acetylase RimI-like enzyme
MTDAGHAGLLAGSFEVVAVHVEPRWHGRGLGRELVVALLRDQPHPRALLTTQAGANPARGFYRRLGFVELDVEVPYEGVPFVVLAADLPMAGSAPISV